MKIPELLVPVGGPDQLRAAIANGADAVYMSGSAFNARLNADNFSDDKISNAIDLAHEYGVRVHITQNTLVKTEEMEAALHNAVRMYEYGADALIIQDRGLASAIKKIIPDMPLHMSTQGTVYDADGMREAVEAGFDRIILSRELSHDEIASICSIAQNELNTEIEIFVHGAICICYSGQCHMSDFIGGRSGNRGVCAQPCRLPYELMLNGKNTGAAAYPLSPADMSLLEHLKEIAEIGVASLKIEGRMKSPEYVALVASTYRKYLDVIARGGIPHVEKKDVTALRQIFSRGSFTDAYYNGESGKLLMSDDTPKHHGLRIGELISADRKRGHAFIRLESELSNGDGIEIRPNNTSGVSYKHGGSVGGIITYIKQADDSENKKNKKIKTDIKNKKNILLKKAEKGQIVEAGDIPSIVKTDASVLRRGTPVYKISDAELNAKARTSYAKLPQRVGIDLVFSGSEGEYASLTVSEHNSSAERDCIKVLSDAPLEKAIKKPADEESIIERLRKTGGTPYNAISCSAEINGAPVISAAELNAMRRDALEKLTEMRVSRTHRSCSGSMSISKRLINETENAEGKAEYKPDFNEVQNADIFVTINIYMTDGSPAGPARRAVEIISALNENSMNMPDNICYRINIPYKSVLDNKVITAAQSTGMRITACLPAISKASYSGVPVISDGDIEQLKRFCTEGKIYGISAANPSQLILLKNNADCGGQPARIFFEESMNIYNAYTAECAHAHGMQCGVVSHELKPQDMHAFGITADICEFSVWGRIPLMYTEHCPAGSTPVARGNAENKSHSGKNISNCCSEHDKKHYCRAGRYDLVDRKGKKFHLVFDDCTCRCTVMSYKAIDCIRDIPMLKSVGINCFRVNIFDESIDEILDVIKRIY